VESPRRSRCGRGSALAGLWLAGVVATARATEPPAPGVECYRARLAAERALADREWTKAEEGFDRVVRANPADGDAWLKLAAAREARGRYAEALGSLEQAKALGALEAGAAGWRIARCRVRAGDRAAGLDALEAALAAGYRKRLEIAGDAAFASLRSDPRFRRLVGEAPTANVSRVDGWRSDVDAFLAEVRRVHFVWSRRPLPDEIVRAADALKADVPKLADAQVVLGLQRLAAAMGDGHTVVYPFGMRVGALRHLPIATYLFSDGLFVIDAAGEASRLVGRKIARIGSLDVETAMKRLEPLVSRDNAMGLRWLGPTYLSFTDVLVAIGATDDPSKAVLEVEAPDGTRESVTIAPQTEPLDPAAIEAKLIAPKIAGVAPPRWLAPASEPWSFELLPDGKTVYFRFDRVLDGERERLADFAIRLRTFLDEKATTTLVVDVRRNNGGEGTLIPEVVRTLVHFETSRADARLFVLIGRNTFSAAQSFASQAQTWTHAVFAGEPTASRPQHVGDEAAFRLPWSGVIGSIACGLHKDSLSRDERVWIAPTIPVPLSSADYFAGRDPVLDAVLEVAHGTR
jgi:tetratricopeptide (TPR) repeat protein